MKRGDVLEIIYQSKRGEFTKRNIRVIEIGDAYVKAYCYTRHMVRMFNKDGILAHQRIRSA
jgi:predicted DNA-binding transcriptional regulator YafY